MTSSAITPEREPIPTAHKARVAVIVPVHRQAAFLEEAVRSALLQNLGGTRIVIVNDGCPDPETGRIGRAFAAEEPQRVVYLAQENKGLSAARNEGIRAAMKRWPEIEAVFPLDADNRLGPETLARLIEKGAGDDRVGFVFPYLLEFGERQGIWQADAQVTLTRMLCENQCDAGSLIFTRVFAAGHFFDEGMREGFEDWEFFIRLLKHGFTARCGGLAGFEYRTRRDSMLVEADAKRARLLGQIRARHEDLFRPQRRVSIEHMELPRFLYLDAESGVSRAFSDPHLMDAPRAPLPEGYVPPVVLVGIDAAPLLKGPFGRGVLLRLQSMMARRPVMLSLAPGDDFHVSRGGLWPFRGHLFAIPSKVLPGYAGNPIRLARALFGPRFTIAGANLPPPPVTPLAVTRVLRDAALSPRLRNDPVVPGETRLQSPPAMFMVERHIARFETLWPQAAPERRHVLLTAGEGGALDRARLAAAVGSYRASDTDLHLLVGRGAVPGFVNDLGFVSITSLEALTVEGAAAQRAIIVAAMDTIIPVDA